MNTSTSTNNTSNKYFIGKEDRYNGIIVDSTSEPCKDIQQFYNQLTGNSFYFIKFVI